MCEGRCTRSSWLQSIIAHFRCIIVSPCVFLHDFALHLRYAPVLLSFGARLHPRSKGRGHYQQILLPSFEASETILDPSCRFAQLPTECQKIYFVNARSHFRLVLEVVYNFRLVLEVFRIGPRSSWNIPDTFHGSSCGHCLHVLGVRCRMSAYGMPKEPRRKLDV